MSSTNSKTPIVARNSFARERLAAGITSAAALAARAGINPILYDHIEAGHLLPSKRQFEELRAALGDIPADRLYGTDMLQILGVVAYHGTSARSAIELTRGAERLFVARDEVTWLERRELPDRKVDAFFSMSCGTLATPHLLLDTVAVAKALGINFVAAAGAAGCCGKPFFAHGQYAAGDGFTREKVRYAQSLGATTVLWCTACQQVALNVAARREVLDGIEHPIREVQILTFLEERVRALGEDVPWKREVRRRVLAEGHTYSDVHTAAFEANARLLSLIPGVEVVATYDGLVDDDSPCAGRSRPAWRGPWRADSTKEEVQARRRRLAEKAGSFGADTVACQHQGCHQVWGCYASERLAVRHVVSILAEALGCAHPDRAQAAAHLGDPVALVEQTRPIWETWGIDETEALRLAHMRLTAESMFAAGKDECGHNDVCGSDGVCAEHIIDVVRGVSPGLRPTEA